MKMSKYTLVFLLERLNKGFNILLLKRKNNPAKNTFTGVGGHLEKDETPLECAIRETYEETGLIVPDIKIVGYQNKIKSYLGYAFVNDLDNYGTKKFEEGIIERYNLGDLDDLPMTEETRIALDYVLQKVLER